MHAEPVNNPIYDNGLIPVIITVFCAFDKDVVRFVSRFQKGFVKRCALFREGANKRGNSSRLTQSFHFFMFEPIFSPVNALNQPI
ncbi:type IV secretory pathway VirB6 component (fragment) [Escherichia coli]